MLSIDGSTGEVYLGELPVAPSPVVEYFEGTADSTAADATDLSWRSHRIIESRRRAAAAAGAGQRRHRSGRRRGRAGSGPRASACAAPSTCSSATAGRWSSGWCWRRPTRSARRRSPSCCRCSGRTSSRSSPRWTARPVTIRLLDPPLHEFLPTSPSLGQGRPRARPRRAHRQGREAARGGAPAARAEPDARAARRAAGHRHPGPVRDAGPGDRRGGRRGPPARARGAAGDHGPAGRLCAGAAPVAEETSGVLAEEATGGSASWAPPIGTMIELPRAALTAAQIAADAEFFSFGTNDLTQTTWGFSRDDVEGSFFSGVPGARDLRGIAVRVDRRHGVGSSSRSPASEGRAVRPDLELGRLRRARRRPRVGALLPRGRAGLRVLLAVPGAGRAPGGGPGGGGRRGGAGTA